MFFFREEATWYTRIITKLEKRWGNLLRGHNGHNLVGGWVRLYESNEVLPFLVCQEFDFFNPKCDTKEQQFIILDGWNYIKLVSNLEPYFFQLEKLMSKRLPIGGWGR
jgi:hypothetical protein